MKLFLSTLLLVSYAHNVFASASAATAAGNKPAGALQSGGAKATHTAAAKKTHGAAASGTTASAGAPKAAQPSVKQPNAEEAILRDMIEQFSYLEFSLRDKIGAEEREANKWSPEGNMLTDAQQTMAQFGTTLGLLLGRSKSDTHTVQAQIKTLQIMMAQFIIGQQKQQETLDELQKGQSELLAQSKRKAHAGLKPIVVPQQIQLSPAAVQKPKDKLRRKSF